MGNSTLKDLLEARRLSLDSVQKNGKQNSCSGPHSGLQQDTEGRPEHEGCTFAPSFLRVIRDPDTWEGQRILKGALALEPPIPFPIFAGPLWVGACLTLSLCPQHPVLPVVPQ